MSDKYLNAKKKWKDAVDTSKTRDYSFETLSGQIVD